MNRQLPKFLQQHAAALGREERVAPEDDDEDEDIGHVAHEWADAGVADAGTAAEQGEPEPAFDVAEVGDEERERFIAQEKAEANALFGGGEYEKAIERYSLAIRVASASSASTSRAMPGVEILYANRAAAFLALDKGEESLKDAVMATHISPGWGKGWLRRARALLELKRFKDAADAADEGLRVEAPGTDTLAALTAARERATRLEDAAVRSGKHSFQPQARKRGAAEDDKPGAPGEQGGGRAKKKRKELKLLSFDEEDAE